MSTSASLTKIDALPNETMLEILSYLRPEDLARVAKVCRQWKIYAYDNAVWNAIEKRLPNLYPSMRVIGPKAWQNYVDLARFQLSVEEPVLTFEEAAPGSKRVSLIPIVEMLHQIAPKVEGNAGITILTIPEGLTFNKLVQIAGSPIKGNPTDFSYIWGRITQELGNIRVQKTYRVVITNNVLVGSRNESTLAHETLRRNLGCEFPGVSEASTLAILTNVIFSIPLLCKTPLTFTRCWQEIYGESLVVGGFGPEGLVVDFKHFDNVNYGALVLRKFPVIGT